MSIPPLRTPRIVAIVFAAVLAAACSPGSTPAHTGTPVTPAPPPVATPLIGSALADPIPVPATDGRTHLAYELLLTNALGGTATLRSLTVSAGDDALLTLSGRDLEHWTRALGHPADPTVSLGSGQSAVVWLDVAVDADAPVPTELTHSVELAVGEPVPGLIGADVTQTVAPVHVSTRTPVLIAPPLDGPRWLDADSCCDMTAHRMALNPINGKLYASERFAVDYVQLTDDYRLFRGAPTALASYPYFGAPVHAAGTGKVLSVGDDLPEQIPPESPSGLPLDQYVGNHVVQDLGDGNYALYAHLKPGSVTVKPGDVLRSGQPIGALGNSGNSSAPHLHFHVMDGPDPLAANGLPFVITSFRLDQRIAGEAALDELFDGEPAPLQPGFAAHDVDRVGPLVFDVMNYSVAQ